MKKPTFIAMLVLEIISLIGGIAGFYFSKNPLNGSNNEKPVNNKEEFKITYKYYLDNSEVATIPTNSPKEETKTEETNEENAVIQETTETTETNEEIDTYSFDKYVCTNGLTGIFDTQKWMFVPDGEATADTTCKLYFVTNIFDLVLNVTNGKLDELSASNNQKIKKGEKTSYTIKPNDGYNYDENSTCNSDAVLEWNKTTNILTISNVTKNTKCNINYKIQSYNVEIAVENGTTEIQSTTVEHGKDAEITFTPNENMVYDSFKCNPQIKGATYETSTNKLILPKLTSDSKCTVTFRQNAFRVTMNIVNGTVSGEATKNVKKAGYVVFDINANEGYTLSKAETTCNSGNIELNGTLAKVSNVTQDSECTITLKEINPAPTPTE